MVGLDVPRLLALATSYPTHILRQDDVARGAAKLFARVEKGFERFVPVYRNAAIETRHSSVPLEWYLSEQGFAARNALYIETALTILEQAAGKALKDAGLGAGDIDGIITVSSSGIATPSLDARLMERMAFRSDVQRTPIFGLGCAGGVLGLGRAAALARSEAGSRVLLLVVELCGLTFRRGDSSRSNLIATALFGDGAAAAIISTAGDGPALGPWGEHTFPHSLDVMGWQVADDGLKVLFSQDIPTLVKNKMRDVTVDFLRRHDQTLADLDGFVCHPGGAKVLDALEACYGLPAGGLVHARNVLREHGNMSAATVLFVLRASMDAGFSGRHLMTSLGPGFTAAFLMLNA
jgi:alkylresorcinol/alkylpyrone synthase